MSGPVGAGAVDDADVADRDSPLGLREHDVAATTKTSARAIGITSERTSPVNATTE